METQDSDTVKRKVQHLVGKRKGFKIIIDSKMLHLFLVNLCNMTNFRPESTEQMKNTANENFKPSL